MTFCYLILLSLIPAFAIDASPTHCLSVCAYAPVGTPCNTLGTSCADKPCACRKPQLEFKILEGQAFDEKKNVDCEGWTPGTITTRDVCRAECLIRPNCLAFSFSTSGECYLKKWAEISVHKDDTWVTEKKNWLRPDGPNPPHIYNPNFLDQEVIDKLRNHVDTNIKFSTAVSRGNSYWDKKVLYYTAIEDPEVKLFMKVIVYRVAHALRTFFNVSEPVYPETLSLGEWTPGMILGSHGDNSYFPSGEPNYTPRRTWSSIIYLNEEFTGGEFYFVGNGTLNLIKPKPGLMIGFGAGPDYFHGVTKIETGRRFTVNMWFSNDPTHFLDIYD